MQTVIGQLKKESQCSELSTNPRFLIITYYFCFIILCALRIEREEKEDVHWEIMSVIHVDASVSGFTSYFWFISPFQVMMFPPLWESINVFYVLEFICGRIEGLA